MIEKTYESYVHEKTSSTQLHRNMKCSNRIDIYQDHQDHLKKIQTYRPHIIHIIQETVRNTNPRTKGKADVVKPTKVTKQRGPLTTMTTIHACACDRNCDTIQLDIHTKS